MARECGPQVTRVKKASFAVFLASAVMIALIGTPESKPITGDRVASHKLGFSGATLSIRESFGQTGWPIANRTFILIGANGHRRELKLARAGGTAGNQSLNLFWAGKAGDVTGSDKYFVISEMDCVEFDPIRMEAKFCLTRPPCESGKVRGLVYLGRYDWMNGYDPPKGLFGWNFRFLPFTDAWESEACPQSRK